MTMTASESLLALRLPEGFGTIIADPPWQFQNRTGKMAPEHRRLSRYGTMTLDDIVALPVEQMAATKSHLYLWVPNALLPEGLRVLAAWGFTYKSNVVWHKIRKDGGPDGRGVGFYFRNTTELILFGVRGKDVRTLAPGRRQVNILKTMKREHSRKPDEFYNLVEDCSWGPRLELFARGTRKGWATWGDQAEEYAPSWPTYANHSSANKPNDLAETVASNVVTLKQAKQAASLNALPPRKKLRLPKPIEPKNVVHELQLIGGHSVSAPALQTLRNKRKKGGKARDAA